MYIEQLISIACTKNTVSSFHFDGKIFLSLFLQINNGSALTEKQGHLAVSLLKKYKTKIEACVGHEISVFLENPQFKLPFRVTNNTKKVSISKHTGYGKVIRVDFPYNEELVAKFKENRHKLDTAFWEKDEKCWIFSLDEKSISFLMDLLPQYNFEFDKEFENLIEQVKAIQKNLENLVPMLVFDGTSIKTVNTAHTLPNFSSNNFIETLIAAKNYGITIWDTTIQEKIDQLDIDPEVKKFILNDPGQPFNVNAENTPIYEFREVLKYLFPCLVVIPDRKELEKLIKTVNMFNSMGVDNSEMTVLFRLSNETNENFNRYVKEYELNTPLTDKTKVVFVCNQIPKTLLKPRKEFNCVLNYNFYNIHYKIRDFILWHQNVINILDQESQRNLNFAIM